DFFLALVPYANALHSRRRIREIVTALEVETQETLQRFVDEQNELIDQAKAIRLELAERAPEIDNSDMERPENPLSDGFMRYELDSFANFDQVADADIRLAYPSIPGEHDDPSPVSKLLGILRGRHRAAEYGEDEGASAEQRRDDLGDIARRIGNLAERNRV